MPEIQPTVLTDEELFSYAYQLMDPKNGLPLAYQQELLKRFEKLLDLK